jgi:hypothetical protein
VRRGCLSRAGLPRCDLVVAFDAEVYLRLLGERLLDDPDRQDRDRRSPLRGPAAALVVAGAIGVDQAWRVIDDYNTVTRIRTGEVGFVHFAAPSRRLEAGGLIARQTVVIDREITFGRGQLLLRDLAISPDGGALRYRWRRDARSSSQLVRLFRRERGFPWGSTPPEIVDPDGNRLEVRAGSPGGDSLDHWDGELELRGTIARDAAWLEVDGTRVDLHRRAARSEVRIEALEDQSPVERFLWRRLAVAEMPSGLTTNLEPLIGALLAAGAVDERSRLLKQLRAVAARMPRQPLRSRPLPGGSTRGLVEPWRSLLRRVGSADGPEWALVLGAVTPCCDGVQFAANSITSDLAGFEVEFEVAPNLRGAVALDELPVAFWARDDRGNRYLGAPNDWSGSEDRARGTMRYWPALDPRAKNLDLLVCVETQQAVVSISLNEDPGYHQ